MRHAGRGAVGAIRHRVGISLIQCLIARSRVRRVIQLDLRSSHERAEE